MLQGPIQTVGAAFPVGFQAPEDFCLGAIPLHDLMAAVERSDRLAIAAMRPAADAGARYFDVFVTALHHLAAGECETAERSFADLQTTEWGFAASMLQVVALAGAGAFGPAIRRRNAVSDQFHAAWQAGTPPSDVDRALLGTVTQRLYEAVAALPAATEAPRIEVLFRYVVSYPRSGSTHLLTFLSYAFGTRNYTVYPAAGRFFSLRFPDVAPDEAVFVKNHVLEAEYLSADILAPIRDGRDSIVSLARFLYAEGSHNFIRRGELADFISFVAARMPYGFWGDHSLGLLRARDNGARIRLVRYEDVVGNFPQLVALARELAGESAVPFDDEAAYLTYDGVERRRMARNRPWSESLPIPEDSYIPQNWTIGGGTIDWRRIFDAPARRRFHELGGTEALIRLGYETDEDWWHQG